MIGCTYPYRTQGKGRHAGTTFIYISDRLRYSYATDGPAVYYEARRESPRSDFDQPEVHDMTSRMMAYFNSIKETR